MGSLQLHATCNPHLRASRKRDHDGSSTCTRRISNPGSRVAATDRRRPFTRVISTKPTDAGATAASGVARSDAIPHTSCSGMVSGANRGNSEPMTNSPSRYCRRQRTNNDRPRSCVSIRGRPWTRLIDQTAFGLRGFGVHFLARRSKLSRIRPISASSGSNFSPYHSSILLCSSCLGSAMASRKSA